MLSAGRWRSGRTRYRSSPAARLATMVLVDRRSRCARGDKRAGCRLVDLSDVRWKFGTWNVGTVRLVDRTQYCGTTQSGEIVVARGTKRSTRSGPRPDAAARLRGGDKMARSSSALVVLTLLSRSCYDCGAAVTDARSSVSLDRVSASLPSHANPPVTWTSGDMAPAGGVVSLCSCLLLGYNRNTSRYSCGTPHHSMRNP